MKLFIFGLGYSSLSIALAAKNAGFSVAGTTRSAEKAEWLRGRGVEAFVMNTPLPNPPPQGGRGLEAYGYQTTKLTATITAFQRHWRPKLLTGEWDRECALILNSLLDSKL